MKLLVCMACLGATLAQAQTKPVEPSPLMASAYYRAEELGLADLRKGPPPSATKELRLWYEGGYKGLLVYVLRFEGGTWAAYALRPPGQLAPGPLVPDTTRPSAEARWNAAVAAGLLTLPRLPARAPSDWVTTDGFGAAIELWESDRYMTAENSSPQSHGQADDLHFMAVFRALTAQAWPLRSVCAP